MTEEKRASETDTEDADVDAHRLHHGHHREGDVAQRSNDARDNEGEDEDDVEGHRLHHGHH
jgi:hypothetical protein